MTTEVDVIILELMHKYNVSFDEAFDRYERQQRQLELAFDRKKAGKIKSLLTHQKQQQFRDANIKLENQKGV